MADIAAIDKRKQDRRSAVHTQTPFWIKSAQIGIDCDDKGAILFSFPKGAQIDPAIYAVHACCFKTEEAFDGDAAITIGTGTLATDAVTTGGVVTIVDADYYMVDADITKTVGAISAQAASAFFTALGTGAMKLITGADATVPVVYASLTQTTMTTGKGRVLLLVSRVD